MSCERDQNRRYEDGQRHRLSDIQDKSRDQQAQPCDHKHLLMLDLRDDLPIDPLLTHHATMHTQHRNTD